MSNKCIFSEAVGVYFDGKCQINVFSVRQLVCISMVNVKQVSTPRKETLSLTTWHDWSIMSTQSQTIGSRYLGVFQFWFVWFWSVLQLLVLLSWQRVSRKDYLKIWSVKERDHLKPFFSVFGIPGRGSNRRTSLPEADVLRLHRRGVIQRYMSLVIRFNVINVSFHKEFCKELSHF